MKSIKLHDVVYGQIVIEDEIIAKVFHCFEFQRLRRIKQLAGAEYIFPNAEHSRFSHSLGVYNVAKLFYNEVVKSDPKNALSETDRIALLLAGLLHDVGHGPFSHLFELVHKQRHEDYSVKIITSSASEVNRVITSYDKNMPSIVASIIEGTHPITWLNQLVSSQLDADRLDYLSRDASNVGLTYGIGQLNWLLSQAKVVNNLLVFESKAISSIEQFLIGRIHMYEVLYLNKRNIAISHLIKWLFVTIIENVAELSKEFGNIFESIVAIDVANKNGTFIPIETYILLDDQLLNSIFVILQKSRNTKVSRLASMLMHGKWPSVYVYPTSTNFKSEIVEKIAKSLDKNGAYDIYRESKPIYNPSKKKSDAIYILLKDIKGNRVVKELSQVSTLIVNSNAGKESNFYIDKSFIIMKET